MAKTNSLRWRLAQFFEIRWWQHYLKNKDAKDYLTAKRDYWHRILAALEVDISPQARVLDAGCGPAGIFCILDTQEVLAIDPLLDQYAKSLTHFNPDHYPNCRFKTQSLEDFQADQPFSFICCLNAINHVADWNKSLDHLTAAAQKGSQLLLGVDVHKHTWLWQIFRHLPGDILHPQQHMRKHYIEALKQRGWVFEKEHVYKSELIFNYWLARFRFVGE